MKTKKRKERKKQTIFVEFVREKAFTYKLKIHGQSKPQSNRINKYTNCAESKRSESEKHSHQIRMKYT